MTNTRRARALVAGTAATALLVVAVPATAEDQTVEATVLTSIAATLSDPVVTTDLIPGANSFGAGTLTVDANVLTAVDVSFDVPAMTTWDGTAYGVDSLGTPLTLTAVDAASGSTGTATSDTGGALASTTLLGETVFSLTYDQPVLDADAPGVYRIVTTFTVTEGL